MVSQEMGIKADNYVYHLEDNNCNNFLLCSALLCKHFHMVKPFDP